MKKQIFEHSFGMLFLIIPLGSILYLMTGYAVASPITVTNSRVKNDTETKVVVDNGKSENIQITYTDANGKTQTTTQTTGAGDGRTVFNIQPMKGKPVTVTNIDQPAVPGASSTFTASLFTPLSDIVVSAFTINPGSELTLSGNTFTLFGGFTTVDTTVDYDPASPTYGIEGGFVSAINIQASGGGGAVQFALGDTPTYTLNLAPIWGIEIPVGGLSVPRNLTFTGMLSFNSILSPFSATFDGNVTFFSDGSTGAQGTLDLITDFGPATGILSASAFPELVPVPEPSTWLLLATGCIGMLVYSWWRRQSRTDRAVIGEFLCGSDLTRQSTRTLRDKAAQHRLLLR